MKKYFIILVSLLSCFNLFAQSFEEPKIDASTFEKVKVMLGGDFALQYQALDHRASANDLIAIGSNFNLPTANMVIKADLAPGIRVNLTTYLSSRHHNEAWVKGGYLTIDKLPFLPSTDNLMQYFTIKVGTYQPNVGDQIYRRSDNGNIINNPFVGNYIMDDMTTNTGIEIMYRNNGLLAMVGANSGNLKPALGGQDRTTGEYSEYNLMNELAFVWKLGFDKHLTEDFRLRVMASGFHCGSSHSVTFHSGDRTGSRYYFVMVPKSNSSAYDVTANKNSSDFGPPSGIKDNTIIANIFAQYKGLEVFGTYEHASGKQNTSTKYNFSQVAIESVYRFGKEKQWQLGARYNYVTNNDAATSSKIDSNKDLSVDRIQIAAGWYMTKNIITKIEYVNQNYTNWSEFGNDAGFKGMMIEAGISF